MEAIVEDEQAKTDLFRRLDEVVTSPDAILASNTSSIPIMKARGRHQPAQPRARRALLQPGPGALARRVWCPR
ncbi:3-hydroxyacyl-CoA dehydrogenase NAD-binding domain-containing protein [Nocardioides convexus]|uniref:3-hydroxyacyl-CoA dehydrogenase NAD-binding domain-containing protein n=1 Tax=Nocardioides convexus TaxID=2712224 RepID=UPI003100B95E